MEFAETEHYHPGHVQRFRALTIRSLPSPWKWVVLLLLVLATGVWLFSPGDVINEDTGLPDALLPSHAAELHTEDLPAMRERGVIRALVTPSMTDFFPVNGVLKGIQVELLEQLENHLNAGRADGTLPLRVVYIPVPFSQLIPALESGRGDIAAAVLTRTPSRAERVNILGGADLTTRELVVHGSSVASIESLEDLAGRSVFVLRGSSYAEHLRALSLEFRAKGLAPITVDEADAHLSTEDLLELVNAGVIDVTVCDDYKARLWAQVLPDIVVRDDLVVHPDGRAGWAVRKNNPELQQAIADASTNFRKGTLLGNVFFERYFGSTQWIDNPLALEERKRFVDTSDLFRHYGELYEFDWLALVAQAYQESGLDHGVRSSAGAVGIMQLRPSTASDPNVGIEDISELENNIHAGAKYMSFLRNRYFSDPSIEETDRLAFTWAAYNAGPRRIAQMRDHAEALGLDRDRWFQNVEYAALDLVGRETPRYVANVYKFYVAYRLSQNLLLIKDSAG